MILVDTSVWVDHFRRGNKRLVSLLQEEQAVCHPFIIGELACGNLRKRPEILDLLSDLPSAQEANHFEVLHFLDSNRLYGLGLGWIDAHLLASSLLTGCTVWTLDKTLREVSGKLGLSS